MIFFVIDSIPDQCKTQEICGIVVSLYPFLIVYFPDKYKTQRMYDEVVDDTLAELKLVPDCFFKSEIIKEVYPTLYADDGLLFFDEDSGDVTFCRVFYGYSLNRYS